MATLPPGWVSDYDGQRWFWVYTTTNHTQYTFPKEGDEWPDYAHFSGVSLGNALLPSAELLPEERLESERQIRRRAAATATAAAAADGSSSSVTRTRNRTRRSVGDVGMDDGIGGTHPVDFEQFGYLGFGAWEHVVAGTCPSPQPSELSDTAVHAATDAASPPPLSVSELSADAATHTSDISLVQSPRNPIEPVQTGNPDGNINDIERNDDNNNNTQALSHQTQMAHFSQENEDAVPCLDSREITLTASPTLITTPPNLPELASASTALCAEELNPAPVELPDTQRTWLEPVPVPNLLNQYPVDMSCAVSDSAGGSDVSKVAQTGSLRVDGRPAVVVRGESGERGGEQQQQQQQQQQQTAIQLELMDRKMVHTDQVPKPLAIKQPSQNPPSSLAAQSAKDTKNREEVKLHGGTIAQNYAIASRKEEAREQGKEGGKLPNAYERLRSQPSSAQLQHQNLQADPTVRPKAPFRDQPRMLLINGRSDLPSRMASAVSSIALPPLVKTPIITMTEATPVTATVQRQVVLFPLDDAHTHHSELYQHQPSMPLPPSTSTPALPNPATHTDTDSNNKNNNKNNMRTQQGTGTASNQGTRREDWDRIVASTQKRWGKIPSVLRPGPRPRC